GVAAVSEAIATAALDLIVVDYEPLRPVTDALDAVEHPEPRIHDYGDHGNLHKLINLEFGDVEAGFAAADLVREDLLFFEGNTHLPMEQHAALADWSADGSITGMHFKSLLDGGGYGSYGVASTYYTGALQTVTYPVPRYKFQGARAFTNKPPCGPKRGHGTPQPRFALEVHLDKIAEQLGIDPAELRLKHLVPPNSLTANWLRIGTMGLGACIDKVVAGSGWKEKFRKLPDGRGVGLACSSYITGAGLPIYWNAMPHSGV